MTDCSIWACWWWCWWWSGFFNMGVPWCSPDWWWWLEEPLKFDFPRLLHQAALWDNADLLEDLLNGEELEYVPQSYRNLTWPKSFSFTLNILPHLRYINSCDSWGRSPVHAAATTESSMCLRILVQVLHISSLSFPEKYTSSKSKYASVYLDLDSGYWSGVCGTYTYYNFY